ncbi:hypothetical protein H2O64_01460 [Kordia sp. YSTF-M3]|uniref:Uncharacterized protein n=1 Tax=Kordia aestuariivivens TaxID=2759037 RepID=A0ABR7Q472_9FLAO|nr:DUF5995 family protein [Kordia aestuariivivens]MBC8753318.1 hypothetical protein [Kordia aestuariivivens]
MQATTIDEVISFLDAIIEENKQIPSTMGYFAALYQKVTCKVKEGIENHFFDDNPRMERLDVIFANRYLQAYTDFKNGATPSKSWVAAFDEADNYWFIVLQHLLLGMNAHINLDLGIAAAEVMKGKNIEDLKDDFDKINVILGELVHDVEKELSIIWTTLAKIIKVTEKFDTILIDFSMKLARDGAWKYATLLANSPETTWPQLITERDEKVTRKVQIVINPGFFIKILLKIIRLEERGTIKTRIEILEKD